MSIEIKVPVLPESVADATIATWHVKPGEAVTRDQNLVDIETDKVVLEVVAPEDGSISELLFQEGDTVLGEQVIAKFVAGVVSGQEVTKAEAQATAAAKDAATDESNDALSPSVRRLIAEHNLDAAKIKGTGVGGRITKENVEAFVKSAPAAKAAPVAPVAPLEGRSEKRVPMTRLRKTIATRLLEAKNSTAMLTTFNEVNMKPIMDIRKQYQDIFEKRHGIRLGFMSFYINAVTEALKRFPDVNASIDGDDIVYHNYFDISIAVSTPRGLVTPVLRDTDTMNLAEIEKAVRDLAIKGRDGKLSVADMTGGNFTVTNGGVFGSLMSTPILNLPQSAILGMHAI
ncbi:2-oxoglutarate dehydrogenase complex dihydrolipoyllysine-residue succinyltransferase, partial [Shewanella sp.]|uniref:2-oxoglutarate dehydrogenase complex dihydrolipoyllysine-residue succinyltransferase n=1 Tax=Shewanella sp. TaxID=50422 RepID=UPI004047152C